MGRGAPDPGDVPGAVADGGAGVIVDNYAERVDAEADVHADH